MTYAELLRKYATDATNEGGMWFSGEYMTVLASIAESIEAENAKLRDELANAPKCEECEAMLDCDECLRADGSHKERRRLSVENAKLRELVCEAHSCKTNEGCCEDCYCDEGCCPIERRMQELGIEVDG